MALVPLQARAAPPMPTPGARPAGWIQRHRTYSNARRVLRELGQVDPALLTHHAGTVARDPFARFFSAYTVANLTGSFAVPAFAPFGLTGAALSAGVVRLSANRALEPTFAVAATSTKLSPEQRQTAEAIRQSLLALTPHRR